MSVGHYKYTMSPDGTADVLERILSTDVDEDVLRALSVREQRYVLYYLLDHERVSLAQLADVLTGWMATVEQRVLVNTDRESVRIGLYHNHLPQLSDLGLLTFDPADKVIHRSPLSEPERNLVEAAYLAEHSQNGSNE